MEKNVKYLYSTSPMTKEELLSFVPNAEFSKNISKHPGEYQYEVTHLPQITRKAKMIKP